MAAAENAPSTRIGSFKYLAETAEPSLLRNGKVLTRRNREGSDSEWVGVDLEPREMPVQDARALAGATRPTIERNGFELLTRPLPDSGIDFLVNAQVLRDYYPHCEAIVREATGAAVVRAFDHNVRSAGGKKNRHRIDGGQEVQGPAHVVHGDYTLTSAPQRLRDLARPPKENDTVRAILAEGETLLDAGAVERAIDGGRFAIINVWRSIGDGPVATHPLALCDAARVDPQDLVVFEIHYADRIGENYFAKPSDRHGWFFYPAMTRDEALLIKQWDSRGGLARSRGADADGRTPDAPCTFSFHSAFEDPATRPDAPDRWSIEVRCVVLYD
ncbi:MAG: CmcJ/NvfI family oxidoreductase [Sneathiellaceae bacterium]